MLTQPLPIWISGNTRSGKTRRLVEEFLGWCNGQTLPRIKRQSLPVLMLAANDDKRRELIDQAIAASQGRYPIQCKTPLGFLQDEVMLFWPLLAQQLSLQSLFPLRLRPETEQELATRFWREEIASGDLLAFFGITEARLVRRLLDWLQLAALSGTPLAELPQRLSQGLSPLTSEVPTHRWELITEMLQGWRRWCLERGFLTYGLISELYAQNLLLHPHYRQQLSQRFGGIFADDLDDYPAVLKDLFDFLLDQGATGTFTFNLQGSIRLGLGADPAYWLQLSQRCVVETLDTIAKTSLAPLMGQVVEMVRDPSLLLSLPEAVQVIQTTSRAALLQQTAEVVIQAVKSGRVQPQEIALIAPGLDAIARYSLIESFAKADIPVQVLNEQRPLTSSPTIRGLLTLLLMIYPGLGQLLDKDQVAEMLVILSQESANPSPDAADPDLSSAYAIDPVRAGLLADYCYAPDPDHPRLLPAESFPRWDRLGHRATTSYERIRQWVEQQRQQQENRLIPNFATLLDRAIQTFIWHHQLNFAQVSALRELMETAQHFWEMDGRLRQSERSEHPSYSTVAQFVQLLRQGTVTANPYPVRKFGDRGSITLANIFQYRAARRSDRWHFWLDAGSPLWPKGGAASLYGANLFLKQWSGETLTEAITQQDDEQRLERILADLLGRVGERVYLCHSDLAVNGQEQLGPLLTLIQASIPLSA